MKTPSTPATTVGGLDPTARPAPASWSSPFAAPHSYTSRPPALHPTLRPWREFLSLRSFSLPYGYSDALLRLRKNISHFRFNYALVALLVHFLSLIFHPFSLLLFLFLSLAWYALYFSRDSPIILFGRVFDDRVVAAVLGVVTIVGLVLTGVGLNVLVALLVAVVIVGVHGVFRNSEDLYVDEESIGEGGLVSVVSSQPLRSYARIG
ncbi:hypothetical protein MLD38_038682 [Melastoma candidum]|uniref:Uncharacterized protein n=1 Tax=Melastoma candidum TaxID=119954 RepID=A0ACB9L0C5_9MYRT|nr:hypothetical protein MLD38_038682 [Melastoma candidum]